jgi:hypothetical protein
MDSWISNLKYVILGLFLAGSVAMTGYEWYFVWPVKKCDQAGAWWDPRDRQCLTPIPIWRVTGRMPAPGAPTKPKG